MTPMEAYMKLRERAVKDCENAGDEDTIEVSVQLGRCSQAAGVMEVIEVLEETIRHNNIKNVVIKKTGSMGFSSSEPIVTLSKKGQKPVTYCNVTPNRARVILSEFALRNTIIVPWTLCGKDVTL